MMECAECDNLLSRYESLTFAAARKESSLQIAERTYDLAAVERLTVEVHDLAAKQRDARAALAGHRTSVHQSTVAAAFAAR